MMSELFTPSPTYVTVPFDLLTWYSHGCPDALTGRCEGSRCLRRAAWIAVRNLEFSSARRFFATSRRIKRAESCGV